MKLFSKLILILFILICFDYSKKNETKNNLDSIKLPIDAVTQGTRLDGLEVEILNLQTYDVITLDSSKQKLGKITYFLTKDAYVEIKAVNKNNKEIIYKRIVPGEWRKKGQQIDFWDAKDSLGNYIKQSDRFIIIKAWTHRENQNEN